MPDRRRPERTPLLPVFLKLRGRPVVVVGGGRVAQDKVVSLLAAGARVTIVAPRIAPALERLPVRCLRREFAALDLAGAAFAVAAAPPEVNRRVAAAAARYGIFVNAVDDPENASAYLGGVLRRGGLTIAVSTEGRAPALAGLVREALEAVLPAELGLWTRVAARVRRRWKRAHTPLAERRVLLLEALNRLYRVERRGAA